MYKNKLDFVKKEVNSTKARKIGRIIILRNK